MNFEFEFGRLDEIMAALEEMQKRRMEALMKGIQIDHSSRLGIFMRSIFQSADLREPAALQRVMSRLATDEDVKSVFVQGMKVKQDPVIRELDRAIEALRHAQYLSKSETDTLLDPQD